MVAVALVAAAVVLVVAGVALAGGGGSDDRVEAGAGPGVDGTGTAHDEDAGDGGDSGTDGRRHIAAAGPAAPVQVTTTGTAPTTATTTAPPPIAPPPSAPPAAAPAAAGGALCVGDSVMLGASTAGGGALGMCAVVDATVSRQMSEGLGAVRAHAPYPPRVVIGLGSNGTVDADNLDALLGELAGVERVVLVTVQLNGGRSWEGQANAEIAAAATRWPNATLADWKGASNGRPELFAADGIHLTPAGAEAYAATLAAAL